MTTTPRRHSGRRARAVALVCSALAATALAACSPEARDDDTLIVSVYPGDFADQFEKHIAEPFREAHPDVDLKLVESGGSAADLAKLRTNKGDAPFDVGVMDMSYTDVARHEGLLANLDPKVVTNLESIDPGRRVADDSAAPFSYDTLVLSYNTAKVSEPPHSWDALWDQDHAGRVVVNESQLPFFLPVVAKMVGEDYQRSIERSVDRLKELAPSVLTWTAQPDPYTLVLNGDADLGLGYNARSQYFADEDPDAFVVTMPSEGSVIQMNTLNMIDGTPNAELAQEFINYAISPKAQAAFATAMYYGPVNTETELDPAVEKRTALGLLERSEGVIELDYGFLSDNVEKWNATFRREVVAKG